jgi:hypothetical protein
VGCGPVAQLPAVVAAPAPDPARRDPGACVPAARGDLDDRLAADGCGGDGLVGCGFRSGAKGGGKGALSIPHLHTGQTLFPAVWEVACM